MAKAGTKRVQGTGSGCRVRGKDGRFAGAPSAGLSRAGAEDVATSQNRDMGHLTGAGGRARVSRKPPRPSGCPGYVRREIADALPEICAMLLSKTMEGDLSSLKLLLQMAVESQAPQRDGSQRSTGFARKVLAGFKEWEAREAAMRRER